MMAGTWCFLPSKNRRTACKVEEHYRFARLQEFGKQFALYIRHLQVGTATAFATHVGTFAHSTYYHVCLICYLQRFCLHFSLVAPVDSLAEFAVLLQLLCLRQILLPCAYNKVAFPASACSIASLMVVYFDGA